MPSRTIQTATYISSVLLLVWVTKAAEPALAPATQATPTRVVIVDDFESYTNDQQLAKAWYKPPHGGGTHQNRESTIKNNGNFSLKFEYSTTKSDDKFYSSICRVSKWNLAGCNALQFWLKPDGSGRALLFGMNIANAEGKNIHDLWEYTYVLRTIIANLSWLPARPQAWSELLSAQVVKSKRTLRIEFGGLLDWLLGGAGGRLARRHSLGASASGQTVSISILVVD